MTDAPRPARHGTAAPSEWVQRFASAIPAGGEVLDVACGSGRHMRFLIGGGLRVTGVDRDLSAVADLAGVEGVRLIEADLEAGGPLPVPGGPFAAVVVINYLHRPRLLDLVEAVAPGGLLIYETFADGNERFGRPRSPEHLLAPGELLELARGRLRVLAYEDITVDSPRAMAIQRICARRDATP